MMRPSVHLCLALMKKGACPCRCSPPGASAAAGPITRANIAGYGTSGITTTRRSRRAGDPHPRPLPRPISAAWRPKSPPNARDAEAHRRNSIVTGHALRRYLSGYSMSYSGTLISRTLHPSTLTQSSAYVGISCLVAVRMSRSHSRANACSSKTLSRLMSEIWCAVAD